MNSNSSVNTDSLSTCLYVYRPDETVLISLYINLLRVFGKILLYHVILSFPFGKSIIKTQTRKKITLVEVDEVSSAPP